MSKGEKNAYYCETCNGYTVTIDVDDGVTPMFLACRAVEGCEGRAISMMYPTEPWPEHDGNGDPIPNVPRFEWYRPTRKKVRKMGEAARMHTEQGGLHLRKKASS